MISMNLSVHEIAFPVTRHHSILHRGGPLTCRYRICDLSKSLTLQGGVLGPTYRALGTKVPEQFLFQHALGLDKQTAINRLV